MRYVICILLGVISSCLVLFGIVLGIGCIVAFCAFDLDMIGVVLDMATWHGVIRFLFLMLSVLISCFCFGLAFEAAKDIEEAVKKMLQMH